MELTLIFAVLFVVGAILGSLANLFVDCFCWIPRYRSPWRAMPLEFLDQLEPFSKTWLDFVPIIGWLSIRRMGVQLKRLSEADRLPGLETNQFWLRPFFVELLAALGTVGLFEWEVRQQMLLPEGVMPELWETVVLRFAVHLVLFVFLLAATLTDFDDMIIPDTLTIPGTILGILFAFWVPQTLLPATESRTEIVWASAAAGRNPMENYDIRHTVSPKAVPLNSCSPNSTNGVWKLNSPPTDTVRYGNVMVGLWLFWCFAMLDRIWYRKLPFRKAIAIFCRYLRRSPRTKWIIAAAVLGIVGIYYVLQPKGFYSVHHVALLSALIGMATGMGLIWGSRLIAGAVLGREAMGFGDVTLMGMIGAFLGWQSCIMIFFLAPFAGLFLGIVHLLLGRSREIPYGPFLCLAAAGLVVFWNPIWTFTEPIFELGGLVVGSVMLVCLVMLGVLLRLWLWIRNRILGI